MKNLKKGLLLRLLTVTILTITAIGAWPTVPARATTTTITETFKNSTAPGWTVLPSAKLTAAEGIDENGDGWLRLTSNINSQAGAAFYNTAYPSDNQFDVEFDYATWGGTGANGLTFFMIDGSKTPTAPGEGGGHEGYYNLDGAYFAVTFEEFWQRVYILGDASHWEWLQVPATNIPTGDRAGAKHVRIIFYNNRVSVWLAGVKVIDNFSWNATMPATVKFGFSGATGASNNYHEVRNASIMVYPTHTILETFSHAYATGWTLLGSTTLTNEGDGWLQLTSLVGNRAGISFYNMAYPSNAAFDVQFDYATYGGTGANGLTFFMIDGSVTPISPGAYGDSLGYGGVAGAYLAISFDEYGGRFGHAPNVAIWDSTKPVRQVAADIGTGDRAGAKHVQISFVNNHVSVWLDEVEVIHDYVLGSTLPASLKFGFSAGTGVYTNYHEIRNASVSIIPADTIMESFGTIAPGWNLLGSATLNTGWLRLTSNINSQAGAAFYNTAYPSDNQFDVEFDYATWGGTGANGLTFFMIDGSKTPTAPGEGGGHEGYYNLDGAYFAVTFEEFWQRVYILGDASHWEWLQVPATNIPTGDRAGAKHVRIIFYNNRVSVWLAGVKVIDNFSWNATIPATVNFGFSGATGASNNYHEVRNAVVRMSTTTHDPSILRVKTSGSSTWPCGSTWGSACSLQTALNTAVPGDELWVAAGTYYPGLAGNRAAAFQIYSGIAIYGGFAGTETSRSQRNPGTNESILSGDIDLNGTLDNGNAYHVVKFIEVDDTTVVDGITITGGNANTASNAPDGRGAGVYSYLSSPILNNLHIVNNSAFYSGGGIYCEGGGPSLTNTVFEANKAGYGGGMANSKNCSSYLENVNFTNNIVHMGGGGMYNFASSPLIVNITFEGNKATYGGGMADYHGSSPEMYNAIFVNNYALIMGGAIYNQMSSPSVTNATMYGNTTYQVRGTIYNVHYSYMELTNSIIWGTIHDGHEITMDGNSEINVTYSDIDMSEGNPPYAGMGNIKADPMFIDAASGDLHLREGSQAIDAGDNSALPDEITTDCDGNPRVKGYYVPGMGVVDMGAYEAVMSYHVFLPLLKR